MEFSADPPINLKMLYFCLSWPASMAGRNAFPELRQNRLRHSLLLLRAEGDDAEEKMQLLGKHLRCTLILFIEIWWYFTPIFTRKLSRYRGWGNNRHNPLGLRRGADKTDGLRSEKVPLSKCQAGGFFLAFSIYVGHLSVRYEL